MIGSLIGAVLLRAAAKWIASLEIGFGKAYSTVLTAPIISVGAVGGLLALAGPADVAIPAMRIICLPVPFLIQAGVINWRFSLTFSKALLITLVMLATYIAIIIVAGLIFFGIVQIVS